MNSYLKMAKLSEQPSIEIESSQECAPVIDGKHFASIPISEVAMPGGKKMKVVKSLLTSACERNCYYCPFRAGRKLRRETFVPDDFANTFFEIFRKGAVEGLLLSSGIIKGGVSTQDRLLDTVEILRNKLDYKGYIHLKIMPGAERDQVYRAMQLANRISINLEGANPERLARFAPMKDFARELLAPLQWANEIRKSADPHRNWNGRWATSTTQFVVGASGENDVELLTASDYLYGQLGLKRVYYSAFFPILDTPLENYMPEKPMRQHRLYESSFLLRDYGFAVEELPFDQSGNLPLDIDPKLAWARIHLIERPIEINKAEKMQLMLIPGIGRQGAMRIIQARRAKSFRYVSELQKIGVQTKRALPFILFNGKAPDYQYSLI